jgi:16S rRNA A1518/A1519 N6-dimethyltransferase RsmA/KsgA/DIM1 with predicted DNA glycosylase/AP lyase activity
LFWGRRKTIASALKKNPHVAINKEALKTAKTTDSLLARAETLTIPELHRMYLELNDQKVFVPLD